jgi:GNAT superfamily N-acetyltransferase
MYVEGAGDPDGYAALFATTGWNEMYRCTPSDLEVVLASSWSVISAYDGSALVGSGRVMSDGILYAVVFDMVIAPTHRGRGIGSEILKKLLARCEAAGIRDVLLFSARGTQDFYSRFGFVPRPHDAPGMIYRRVRVPK